MKKKNNFLKAILIGLALGVVLIFVHAYRNDLERYVLKFVNKHFGDGNVLKKNEYYRDYNFSFVQNTNDFEPNNYQDIVNIFYTVINSGSDFYTFTCPKEYNRCIEDVKILANDQLTLSTINNFVHPYNSFKHIETQYNSYGDVTITLSRTYNKEDIERINTKIDELFNELTSSLSNNYEKIRAIHDYIINNSVYDVERVENNNLESDYAPLYKSDIAYGPLLQGYGICGGYSDAMQLFLEKLGVKNFKVSSEDHVWNAAYLDNVWYNLDLTWDDPVTYDGSNVLEHTYFLISTIDLITNDKDGKHNFDHTIYKELQMIPNNESNVQARKSI